MPHINVNNDLPGIRSLMAYRPETAPALNELAERLLRDENNSLSRGERELIAAHVSYLNNCFFCQNVHGALAAHYLQLPLPELDALKMQPQESDLSDKMKALLSIAAAVQAGGKSVEQHHIDFARAAGASDRELHDTVLIAAAFCMYNRYVDGLATWAPADRQIYMDRAPQRALEGYINTDLNT